MMYSQNRYHLNLFDSEVLKRLGPVWWDLLAPRGVGQGLGILNLFTTHHLSCEITPAPKSKVSFPAGTPSTPGHKPANKASLFPPMNQRPGFSEFLIGVTNWISKTLGGCSRIANPIDSESSKVSGQTSLSKLRTVNSAGEVAAILHAPKSQWFNMVKSMWCWNPHACLHFP